MDNEKENNVYDEKSNDFEKNYRDYKKPLEEDYIHMKILNELAKNSPENVEKIQKEHTFEEKTENIEKSEEKGNQIIEEGEDKKQAEIGEKIDETAIDSSGEHNITFQFSSDKVGKYKEKFKNQHVLYENVILDYKKWISRIQELVAYIKKGYENIEKESGKNELNIKLEKMIQIDEVSCNKLFNVDGFENLTEEQVKSYINANRNIIEDGIKERDSLIEIYFVLVNSYIFPLIDNFNFKSSIGTDIEEKKQRELQKIKKYKEQLQSDDIAYEKSLLEYKTWIVRNKELVVYLEKNCMDISRIIEEFNASIEHKIDMLEEKDKELLTNRIKGINMINKMCRNMLNMGLNKMKNIQEKSYDKLFFIEDFQNLTEEQITNIFNSNYNIITSIRNEKDSIVRSYFKFINSQLLPIIDGVDSGIQYLNTNNITALKYIISDIYENMDKVLKELLENIKIREIKTNKSETINFNLHQAIDIEYTRIQEMDETVAEVIRKGYEYLEDIYSTGINYIVRQVQVIAYKFKAPENTSV
ncbi:hypothetical protein [Clostridium kluyveri]|uniref:Uncharacterized protein n=2 Tax=Clostridium kluyveri TaxID=1534 RepID=A5MZQ5_CLOK5|nr:hypothetical protein [Clostridium kluyveri]EDK34351.1 Hypothetical protein CKL_2339 [Clostridium kluyveri DSM 555]BAH07110.1 hypothetical protein CKR_2059 [Clostridium kluyveri NBRC 12016]